MGLGIFDILVVSQSQFYWLFLLLKILTEKCLFPPQVENQTTQSHRLSRCLSQTWFSSSETSMSDVNFEEQKTNKKVTEIKLQVFLMTC